MLSVPHWPIIMIRPGGLLLVVPHLFAVPVSVLWVGFAKENRILAGSHILSTAGDALSIELGSCNRLVHFMLHLQSGHLNLRIPRTLGVKKQKRQFYFF